MPSFKSQIIHNQCIVIARIHSLDDTSHNFGDFKYNFRALIDTGAQTTGISKNVVKKLNLMPRGKITMGSVHGSKDVKTYKIMVYLPITANTIVDNKVFSQSDYKFIPITQAPEMDIENQNFDVILGMDFLLSCNLILAHGEFIISF